MSNFWEKDKPVQANQPPVQKVNFWEKDKPVEQDVLPPVAEVAPVAQPQAKGPNLADLVTNNPFVSQSGEKPIPLLLERPEYKNLWPETSYLRTPEPAYTLDMPDGQEVLISLDGKSMTGAVYNKKTNTFDFEYTEKADPVTAPGVYSGGRGFYAPPTNVTKIQKVDPSKVLGYTNAADKLESAKVAFGRSIIPTASGFAGFAGGSAIAAGLLGAPETFGASLIPLLAGAVTGFGTGMAGQSFQDRMFPLDKAQQLALESNPKVAGVAGFAPAFIGAPTSPRTWMNLASKTPGVASKAATQLGSNAVMMGALGTGNDVGANLVAGKPALQGVGLGSILHHTGTGLLLGHPNKIGRVMEAPGRFTANTALMPFGKGEYVSRPSTTLPDLEAAAAEAQAQAQAQPTAPQAEAPAPAPAPVAPAPAPATRPEGSVAPRPRYDDTYRGRGKEGIDEYTAAWQAWDAQYGQTHWSDGTPKNPTPAATEASAPAPAANVEAYPAMPDRSTSTQAQMDAYLLAGQEWTRKYGQTHNLDGTPKAPKPVAPKPAPAATEAPAPQGKVPPRPNVPDVDTASEAEWQAFLKDSKEWDSKYDLTHFHDGTPLGERSVEIRRRIREERKAAEAAQNQNASGTPAAPSAPEAPKPAPVAEATAQAAQAQAPVAEPAPAPAEKVPAPVAEPTPAPRSEATEPTQTPAPAQEPVAPAPNQKKVPDGIVQAREQLAKLEASGQGKSNQANARREYIRKWEKANGLEPSVPRRMPKPTKPAPAEEPVSQTPVEPVATATAPVTTPATAEAPKATFDRPKLERISKGLDGVENYRQNQQTKNSAAGRLKNLIKQLEAMFPGIVERVTSEDFIKRYDLPSKEVLAAEPHQMADALMREVRAKLYPEETAQMDRALGRDTAEATKPVEPVAKEPVETAQEAPANTSEKPYSIPGEGPVSKRRMLEYLIETRDWNESFNTSEGRKTSKELMNKLARELDVNIEAEARRLAEKKSESENYDPVTEPNPKENPKDVAEREALTQQENPADTTEPTAKEVEINTTKNIIGGLEKQIAAKEAAGKGNTAQAKKQRATLEVARKKLAELEGKTEEPVAQTKNASENAEKSEPSLVQQYKKAIEKWLKDTDPTDDRSPENLARAANNIALYSGRELTSAELYALKEAAGLPRDHRFTNFGDVEGYEKSNDTRHWRSEYENNNNGVPGTPESTVASVQRIAGVKLSKGAKEELAIRSEEGLQPDFIDEGNIKSLKDHLKDLVERLDSTIDASRNDPYEGPKARKEAKEAKKAVEAAIAKLEAEEAQTPKSEPQAEAPKATEPTPVAEAPKKSVITKVRDFFKEDMKNAGASEKPDTLAWLAESGRPSSDTGRRLRYGYELSDGRVVSAEGALKETNPEAYERIKQKHQRLSTASARKDIFDALPKEVKEQTIRELPIDEWASSGLNAEGVNAKLAKEGHILADNHDVLKGVMKDVYRIRELNQKSSGSSEQAEADYASRNSKVDVSNVEKATYTKDGKFVTVPADDAGMKKFGWDRVEADTTSAERQVEAINDKLAELERTKKGDSPEAEALRAQRDKLQATIDAQKPDSPDVRSAAEKWADETIAEGKKRLNTGLDPELLAAYAVKGAIKFGRTLKDFKEFSREMINEFGNGIRPHLKAIFDKAQEPGLAKEYADQQQARNAAGRPEPDLAAESEKMAQLRAEERENNRELAEGRKPVLSAGGRTWRSVVDSPVVAFFKHIGMRMRTIADNNPQSETAQKIVNDFSLIPGTKETGRDYNTAHSNERTKFLNKFSIALGPVLKDMRRMSAAELVKFNDLFIQALEGRIKVGGETGEAVKRVQEVMNELYEYGKEAGLEMGKVTDYFPRMINAEMVMADRAGFEEAAARAYERQWERQQKEEAANQSEFGFTEETTQRPNFKKMARDWATAIELNQEGFDFERGIFDEGNAATKENFQKNREFTKEEAAEFDAFREKDFETVLTNHIGAMARRAEVARRLGADGMKWTEIASKLAEEAVSAEDIAQLKNDLQSNLGIGETLLSEKGQNVQNAYNLVSTTAFLKLTGLLNVAEPGSIGIRERDPVQGAKAMISNLFRLRNVLTRMSPGEAKAVKTEIERIYGKGHDLFSALAIELGINNVDHGLGSLSSGFHLDSGTDAGGKLRSVNDNVYRLYGIHATEVAKRETSIKHGMQFIDKSIQFFEGNSNLQRIFRAMGKDVDAQTLAKDRIMELGIKEADVPAFIDFAKTLRGMDSNQQLKAIMADSPMASKYREALQIFNKQSSVQATRASRQDIANKHPIGKGLFQFATYTNEWASQHGRYMLETAKKVRNSDGRYNASERLLAFGVAPAFAMATAGMLGIRHIINKLTGFQFEDSEAFGFKVPAWVKTMADATVYTGILGPAELAYKWVVRDQPPGGVLSSWINSSTKAFAKVKENPESNAAQKNVAKVGYRGGVVPVTNSGLAIASGAADAIPNPIARGAVKLGAAGLAQYVANNQTEEKVATAIAGEDKKGPKNPPKPTPPRPPSPPTPR